VRVALIQLDLAWEDPAENRRRAAARLGEAAAAGARLAILPEMFSTGFSMDAAASAEPEGGPTERFLQERAAASNTWIAGSIAQRAEGRARNVALVVSPTGTVARYAKIHPFSPSGEHRFYGAGESIVTVAIDGLRVTPFVCYDLRFPEPFRAAAEETDAYVVVANWPDTRREHWRTLLRARAIENLAYVIGVNRVGEGGGLRYSGDSAAIAPSGETIAEAGPGESVVYAEIDRECVAEARRTFPYLADRRPEAYRR
jgi:predicted amidohydrolase